MLVRSQSYASLKGPGTAVGCWCSQCDLSAGPRRSAEAFVCGRYSNHQRRRDTLGWVVRPGFAHLPQDAEKSWNSFGTEHWTGRSYPVVEPARFPLYSWAEQAGASPVFCAVKPEFEPQCCGETHLCVHCFDCLDPPCCPEDWVSLCIAS